MLLMINYQVLRGFCDFMNVTGFDLKWHLKLIGHPERSEGTY